MESKCLNCFNGNHSEVLNLNKANYLKILHKPLFNYYFQKYPPKISELTFTNLFIWRKYYNFKFIQWQEHLLIFSQDFLKKRKKAISNYKDPLFFLPPIGKNPDKIISDLFNEFDNIEMHRVSEDLINKLKENNNPDNFKFIEDRNNWDYVYRIEDLINLPGQKYRQNRRWLTKFLNNYDYQFYSLNNNLISKCKELQVEWLKVRNSNNNIDLLEESKAIYDSFSYYFELDFKGGVLLVNSNCAAYTFGEELDNETLVIHIEKANQDYIGAYQAINYLFLKSSHNNVKYVNREQDLGIPSLRRAKESYKPHHMIKKNIIYKEI